MGSHLVRTLEDLGHGVSVLEGDEKRGSSAVHGKPRVRRHGADRFAH
ncbi:MAG: hypothetical protein ACLU9S_04015 [Oscillospiraceae bacterium]